ncbi:MAG: S8 family serine peptidase [Patescibacteria group bacterium]|nr:S8 family serine peptidase [Patescibacteria group bacterium]
MNKRLLLPALLVAGLVLCAPNGQPAPSPTPVTPATGVTISALVHGQLAPLNLIAAPVTVNSSTVVKTVVTTPVAAVKAPTQITQPQLSYTSDYTARQVGNQAVTADGRSYPINSFTATSQPNDPQANQPWVTSANLSAAWDTPRGNNPTLLAIIDTGFALKHQEFAGRFYTNPGEVGPTTLQNPSQLNCTDRGLTLDKSCNLIDDNNDGIVDNETGTTTKQAPSHLNCTDQGLALDKSCNLLDNDGNGFTNDVTGWDFAYNTPSVQAGKVTPSGAGTHHGTYVTGVAAATGNNGIGLAGVDWATKILPLQALDDTGSGNTVSVANAIDYAIARHANVISLSLGSTTDDQLVHQAVRRAIAAGIVVVAAAGNDGCDCMIYPANYPEVVSVGAADSNGQLATFSSYGANLKILAPGVNLFTTDWQSSNQTNAYASGISGTSLATPVVSGLITRLLSLQPNASAAQLVAALTENTNHTGLTAAAPHSNTLGYGFLNAGAAILRMATAFSPNQLYSFNPVSTSQGLVYQCEANSFGTTPVYELLQNGTSTFTANVADAQIAIEQGATANIFSYDCLSQPQDTPLMVRSLNIYSEFRNTFNK